MSKEFDPFGAETTALPPQTFFGEIVLLRGFQGIKITGERGFQEYDSENPTHQTAIKEENRKVYPVYEIQHFPMGVSFETYSSQWPIWSDEWKTFEQSFAKLLGLNPKTANDRTKLYGEHIRALTNGETYFEYETPVIRTYISKQDGQEKSIRGIRVLRKFANEMECVNAKNDADGEPVAESVDEIPVEEQTVSALPFVQAIGFVDVLAMQVSTLQELQSKIDGMPMLAELKVEDPRVVEAATNANPQIAPF
jgi:hypothetical protein